MKRLIALVLCAVMTFCLFGCGSTETEQSGTAAADPQPEVTAEPTMQETEPPVESLKILAIGNSFSVDAMEYLYAVAKAEGVKEVILGNLFVGGCSLQMHVNYIENNAPEYRYYKNSTGAFETTEGYTVLQGLQDEDWDIITMQQGSAKSGLVDSYQPYLDKLIAYVNENKTNPDAKLVWHMTWAYQGNSTHDAFPNYGNSQSSMYFGIVNCLQKEIDPNEEISMTIPVGTAIQNARTSYFGDTLTRDGYHLNNLGRLIASYTWYAALTGRQLKTLNIGPLSTLSLTDGDKEVIAEAVNNAITTPQQVTYSTYKSR